MWQPPDPRPERAAAVLVTGATGAVGRHVVHGLLAAGLTVRALTRDPSRARLPAGVDVRVGDLGDPAALRSAVAGVELLYLFPAPDPASAAGAAKAAGVRHVVLLSSASVEWAPPDVHSPRNAAARMAAEHRTAEVAVERAGLPHTFLRPGPFMGNDLLWAPEIVDAGTVSIPYPDAASAPVDERDVAEAAVAALRAPDRFPSRLSLTGPESLTQRRRVEVISEVVGAPVRLVELSRRQARERWSGLPAGAADHILDTLAAAPGTATIAPRADAFGLTRRTYRTWVTEHLAQFRPVPTEEDIP